MKLIESKIYNVSFAFPNDKTVSDIKAVKLILCKKL